MFRRFTRLTGLIILILCQTQFIFSQKDCSTPVANAENVVSSLMDSDNSKNFISGSNTFLNVPIFFIDQSIHDKESILEKVANQTTLFDQSVFHLFAHGRSGELFIDGQWLNADRILDWLTKENLLNNKTHLNIYGCNFAKDVKGKAAVSKLEIALGISIAASDDLTGYDGDW